MSAPSGEQTVLRHGPWEAVVVEVGGALRELTRDGQAVLDGYPEGEMASGGRGQPLMPWPNRLAGGAYEFGGRRMQAPLSEPAAGNAIHGLVRWSNWTATDGFNRTLHDGAEAQPAAGLPVHARPPARLRPGGRRPRR